MVNVGIRVLVLAMGCLIGSSMASLAQQTPVWADVDCTQSKIMAPAGLKCRATQEYAGGTGNIAGAGAGGTFRRWAIFGTVGGSKYYYYLIEGTGAQSHIVSDASLQAALINLSPEGKDAKNFSQVSNMNGSDFLRFVSATGGACVGIRKHGPNTSGGFKWMLYASRCAQPGKTISDSEIGSFVAATGYRT